MLSRRSLRADRNVATYKFTLHTTRAAVRGVARSGEARPWGDTIRSARPCCAAQDRATRRVRRLGGDSRPPPPKRWTTCHAGVQRPGISWQTGGPNVLYWQAGGCGLLVQTARDGLGATAASERKHGEKRDLILISRKNSHRRQVGGEKWYHVPDLPDLAPAG